MNERTRNPRRSALPGKKHTRAGFRSALFVPIAIALLAAACQEPQRLEDYRAQHPLSVSTETISLALPSGEPPVGENAVKFARFVKDYHDRGVAPLVIKTGNADKEGSFRVEQARRLLKKAGVSSADIAVAKARSGGVPGKAVVLTYTANAIKVPECGKFPQKMTPDSANRGHANFGCATQRNLGLMLSNPGDYKKARPMTGADPGRATGNLNVYRTGGASE